MTLTKKIELAAAQVKIFFVTPYFRKQEFFIFLPRTQIFLNIEQLLIPKTI